MADSNQGDELLEDGEFWLPPQFLCDREPSPEERTTFPLKVGGTDVGGLFPPAEYGIGWRTSNFSSPGESVVGSAEDSDEEDFTADLTRKFAQSTLVDAFPPLRSSKGWYSSGSPKSTLCDGCGCSQCSLRGNPSVAVQLKSLPPQTPGLLYQAAGKVANIRIKHQRQQIERVQYLQQQQRLNHLVLVQPCDSKSEVSPYPYPSSSQQQLQFQPSQASGSGGGKFGKGETMLSSLAWPTLQQARQPRREPISACVNGRGTGTRAVFLGSNNVYHRGSAGTGVFLPRRAGPDPEPKRKQRGCSTVLIPAKVVQAINLNLNLDKIGSQPLIQPCYDGRFASENDGAWRIRSGRQVTQQPLGIHHVLQPVVSQEISLPQEWTY